MPTLLHAQDRFSSDSCQLSIVEPEPGRLLIALEGRDLGQLGRLPFEALERKTSPHSALDICFDLRRATGATLEASARWALWLRKNRARLAGVRMLTARPFVTLSAKTVRRFAGLEDLAEIYAGVAPREFW